MERVDLPTPVVSSFNEWDPLEEVIVGVLKGACELPWEDSLRAVTPSSSIEISEMFHLSQAGIPVRQELIDAAKEERDEFVRILQAEGVHVVRPEAWDQSKSFGTPEWTSPCGNSQVDPRDIFVVIGDEIIEATMSWKSRYFEFLPYRELIKDYFRRGAKWTAAPKPRLSDQSYQPDYKVGEEYVISEFEPLFDAADLARCGRDIFVQKSHVTNEFAIRWLARHLGDQYRLHMVEFHDYRAIHIDATFVPLAPGKIMVNPDRPIKQMPKFLENSDWELRPAPKSTLPENYPFHEALQWLSMNVLSLDEKRVIVEASEEPLIKFLKNWGFDPIPCPYRNNYCFGGSFHCSTVDIRRKGTLQSYF